MKSTFSCIALLLFTLGQTGCGGSASPMSPGITASARHYSPANASPMSSGITASARLRMIEREKAKKKSQRIQGGLITITSDLPADISMNGAEVGVIERRGERYFGVPAGSFVVTLTHVDESSGQKISLSKAGVMTLSGEHELSFEFLSIDPSEREDEPLPDPQKSVHTSPLTD